MDNVFTDADYRGPAPVNPVTLARRINRHRARGRPHHPRHLDDFELDPDHIPAGMQVGECAVGDHRHFLFGTEAQLDLLGQAKTWYVDGTFKVSFL